ncbi:MAG: hypothetical protein CM1200mP15_02130 [Dehalococcoidia bacterium]|nr:MAG: hypothetical protein CM1200mP15_02130 [Dehalococcoidia bacterium]
MPQSRIAKGICFIPFGDYKEFLKERVESIPGDIVDLQGVGCRCS